MVTHESGPAPGSPETSSPRVSSPEVSGPRASSPGVGVEVPDDARARFRDLPPQVRVEDMIATQPAAPDPVPGGDPDVDWLLRNAG